MGVSDVFLSVDARLSGALGGLTGASIGRGRGDGIPFAANAGYDWTINPMTAIVARGIFQAASGRATIRVRCLSIRKSIKLEHGGNLGCAAISLPGIFPASTLSV